MLIIPAGVLLAFSIYWLGGPSEFLRFVNDVAAEGLTWIRALSSN